MKRKLRIGIAGLGRIFDLNCLGYINHPEVEVVALCDIHQELLGNRSKMFPEATLETDYERFLKHELDLVEILTPHPLHEAMTVAALQASSHVSVQKPMAMTESECDHMIKAAEATGRHLKLFENFVFYPPLVKAKQLLNDGAIGDPAGFRMKVIIGNRQGAWTVDPETNAWRFELGAKGRGGPLVFDHGHHMMAVALWLFGEVRDAFALIQTTTPEPGRELDAPSTLLWRHLDPFIHGVCDINLALEMTIRTDYYASHEQFEIQGSSGFIRVNRCSDRLLDEPVLTLYRDGETRAWHNLESDWGESFRASTLHFIDFLQGREPEIVLSGEQGKSVVELFHMFNNASQEGRLIVKDS